jgi:uncharacterized membrane protein YhaH (DUF805 family)
MGNLVELYTTSTGRIGRQQWWIGVIVLAVANIAIQLIIAAVFGLWTNPSALAWVSLILFLIVAYPLYNLYLKRRHDRDNNGLDGTIYLAVIVLMVLLQAAGISVSPQEVPGVGTVVMPNMIGTIMSVILLVYSIYILVVMGFLRGTVGPNQYGPDPVGGGATATA